MTRKLLLATTLLFVVALVAFGADVSGKWTYQRPSFQPGGEPTPVTITLKADGAALTGSVPGFGGRGGAAPAPTEISNGKVDGDKIYFETSRAGRGGGAPSVTKYEGTVSGDEIKLKITSPGRGGGDPMVTDVVAKREK